MRTILILFLGLATLSAHPTGHNDDPFRQLDEKLPTPNANRTASGAPGYQYWQQRADYEIAVFLDEEKHRVLGDQTITYTNNSPDELNYLWLQLDRNRFRADGIGHQTYEAPKFNELKFDHFRSLLHAEEFDGSYQITSVTNQNGKKLKHTIVQTMMRVDLPKPLRSGRSTQLKIKWDFAINDRLKTWARSGYEIFPEDGSALYQIAQFFPRMAAYTDVNGWQNKQFLGRGEFALEFGDYTIAINVPADHVVACTGMLQNPNEAYSKKIKQRLDQAAKAKKPIFIVTEDEAKTAIKEKSSARKTWIFKADNVRDVAFASSRRFMWDAVLHQLPNSDQKVWAMSFYPPEAEPLWSQYSTASVIHALNTFSKHTFDYPYPACISVHGKIFGMEYPMLSFNGCRPEKDGTYTEKLKKSLISVIIHEVGHNWFPMIVNSDERQWTWMDEGLVTFLQSVAEEEWSDKPYHVPGRYDQIASYMADPNSRPIMTNSESVIQFGSNAYRKPAVALLFLRETIMGRELFDFALKEYANRWRFKRPEPADFFRSMEDASGMDLDWFWQGWFYTTDHLDFELGAITEFTLESGHPKEQKARQKTEHEEKVARIIHHKLNADLPKFTDGKSELRDFYDNEHEPFKVTKEDLKAYEKKIKDLSKEDKALWKTKGHFYQLNIKNIGGLVSPVLLSVTLDDGSTEDHRIPAEIWKRNHQEIKKLLITKSPVTKVAIDVHKETPETNFLNNAWPREIEKKPFSLKPQEKKKNPMQKAKAKEIAAAKAKEKTKAKKETNKED